MAFGPRLPENAPFTAAQRAWLDGYIAGWFGFGTDTAPPSQSVTAVAAEVEDFPWHDPTLAMEDRLALAEGRQPERVLMAAMAQLDCGHAVTCARVMPRRSSAARKRASADVCQAARPHPGS